MQDELDADEGEDERQPVPEVDELGQGALEDEVERAQAEQGEGVRREDEVGVAGDPVDRGHRVDGEDDVGAEDGDRDEGEGRQGAPPALADGQARAGIRVGDGVEAADQPHAAELVDVDGCGRCATGRRDRP